MVKKIKNILLLNALLFTSGTRYYDESILFDKRIIIIENPKSTIENVNIVTVEDDGSNNPMRKYTRTEEVTDVTITEFDGEGLVSPRLADSLAKGHSSFQIRMPYIKGVVHKVDFVSLLTELDVPYIIDMRGNKHNPTDVDIILTDSMFKGLKWMAYNNLTWSEYLKRCRDYNHALYISGLDKLALQNTTELNYQFLNTLSITEEEFRRTDLPLGWHSFPEYDSRQWVKKLPKQNIIVL